MQHLAHFGSLEELLPWLLAVWMAAGWLLAGWVLAGWTGTPGAEGTRQCEGKMPVHGGWGEPNRRGELTASFLETRKLTRLQDWKTGGLERLQGCQLARLEDWKGLRLSTCKTGRLEGLSTWKRNAPQPGGP